MSDYTGTSGVHNKTLGANTADKVTLSADTQTVHIIKLSALSAGVTGGEIYYRVHATDADAVANPATVGGATSHVLPDALAAKQVPTPAAVTILTLISAAGGVRYSVEDGSG